MFAKSIRYSTTGALLATLATLAACGGGGNDSMGTPPTTPQSVNVPLSISDASSEDWATIGVKILSVAFVPQGGGSDVTVYTAANPVPTTNLVQLDDLSEVIGSPAVPAGTYSAAVVTVSANPGDVALVTAAEPETGFPLAGGTTVPGTDIQIQNTTGAAGSLTVPVKVKFESPVMVASGQTTPVDLEFDLAHPAFILGHTPPSAGGTTLWAVNFNGPLRHHRIDDIRRLVLRHAYGTVSSVATDHSAITIAKDLPTYPVVNPETGTATGQSLTMLADASNGTLFVDVDAKTSVALKDFSSVSATLPNRFVRVAARYQQNGTLVATRIWVSNTFNAIWQSPEGHVLHVNAAQSLFVVSNESGQPVNVTVDSGTEFFFRTPQDALADTTPIGTGPAFLTAQNLVRGFKIHATVRDPLATPLVAATVDIETAAYAGRISNANAMSFTYSRKFLTVADDYSIALPYISSSSANGKDSNGNALTGFKFWDFAFPTQVDSGANAISDFVAATTSAVNFGGTVGPLSAWGVSYARWGDAANLMGWSAPWTVLVPTPLPRGAVAAGLAANSFTMTVPGGAMPATVDVSAASGSATLVYQVDRSNGVVTVSPEDITTSAGLNALTSGLAVGAPVKVYGVPQADGTLKAYVVVYFTGLIPTP